MKEVKYVVRRENNRCIIIIIDSSREEICTSIALFYPFTRECREILASIRFLARLNLPSLSFLLPCEKVQAKKSREPWRGGKRLKSDEKSSGPVFESRKSKKKRERDRDRGIRCQCFLDTDEILRFLPGCVLSRWITQDDIGLLRTSVCVPRNPRRDRVGPVPNCFRSLYRCFANGRLYDDLVEIDDKQIFRWKAFEPLLSSVSLSLIDSLTRLYI